MTQPSALYDVLNRVLMQAEDCLTTHEIALPETRFVSLGEPAQACCDFLAVWAAAIRPSIRGTATTAEELSCGVYVVVDINVKISRCISMLGANAEFPTQEELDADALAWARDAWVLFHCLICRAVAGTLLEEQACTLLSWGASRPHALGGCGGSTLTLTVQMS